jgi:hypothetical protein
MLQLRLPATSSVLKVTANSARTHAGVQLNADGDVSECVRQNLKKELLSAPIRMAF